jgi:hypothetical protein
VSDVKGLIKNGMRRGTERGNQKRKQQQKKKTEKGRKKLEKDNLAQEKQVPNKIRSTNEIDDFPL